QSRCMTRLMSDNSCDTANNFFLGGPAFGSFPTKVMAMASAKLAYSKFAYGFSVVPAFGTAAVGIDIGLSLTGEAILSAAQSRLESAIKDQLIGELQREMKDFAKDNQNQIEDAGK